MDIVVDSKYRKIHRRVDKPPGDVFNIDTLLYFFVRFGITRSHRILLITNPVAPAVDWFLQLVTQQAALDPKRISIHAHLNMHRHGKRILLGSGQQT
ncbi:hypothetical protein [Paenibacillus sp. Root52]|uniref:hypothetical protein n=1 Tax=Paenibacillus sp. Root52 TaxID=1736552 RepID=UPI0012E3888D|nr:hypothetical protein [Paenibacillus sp. Root52]